MTRMPVARSRPMFGLLHPESWIRRPTLIGSVTVGWEDDPSELPYRLNDTSFGFGAPVPGVGLVRDALDDARQIRPVYLQREG